MSLVVLCFPCCVDEQPPPRRRPKIDRTMIGEPMGFKHTGHIGSGELATGFDIHNVQDQMQSKGGYEYSCNVSEPEALDLRLTEGNPGDKQSDQSQQNNSPEVKQQGDQNQETQGYQTHQTEAVSQNDQNSSQDESNRTAEPNQL